MPDHTHELEETEEQELTLEDIYTLLTEGKKVQLYFPTEFQLTIFRTRLHELRTRRETKMIELGIMEEKEKLSIGCSVTHTSEAGKEDIWSALFFPRLPKPKPRYKVLVMQIEQPEPLT